MQTIHVEVEENKMQTVLTLLENLKDVLIKNITIDSDSALQEYKNTKQFQEDRAYFQKCLEEIEGGKTKCFSQDEYNTAMGDFTSTLRQKYANR